MKPLHIGPKASFRPDSSLRSSLLSRSCRRRHNSPLVPYHSDSLEQWTAQVPVTDPIIHKVTCEKTCLENVWIPKPSSISIRPHHKQQDELEDWEADVSALFEWIGMAGFHSERLHANDRVDPYVALYEPPTASRVGNVVHLQWKGLLSPDFVQSMIDVIVTYLRDIKLSSQSFSDIFVALTAHGVTNSPVVYLPQSLSGKFKSGSTLTSCRPPAHLPREDGEDTWCLVLTPSEGQDVGGILMEIVGQWDARWG